VDGGDELPAWSVHPPVRATEPASGPLYSIDVQEAIPEVGSDPAHEIRSAWLYQPFASATRPGAMLVTGAVAS
jgi:hypothetical protein